MFGPKRGAPVQPVRRQGADADGHEVLLDLEDAIGGAQLQILECGAHVDAILRIEQSTPERRAQEQQDDRTRVSRRVDAAESVEERQRADLRPGPNHRQGLVGHGAQQHDGQQAVRDQQDDDHFEGILQKLARTPNCMARALFALKMRPKFGVPNTRLG